MVVLFILFHFLTSLGLADCQINPPAYPLTLSIQSICLAEGRIRLDIFDVPDSFLETSIVSRIAQLKKKVSIQRDFELLPQATCVVSVILEQHAKEDWTLTQWVFPVKATTFLKTQWG
ncbi:hypothetical protein OKW21_004027 [Catalinimonas alkaloidigena]|uniref:hypothetical protein n=1 Tax=Catalinimonas alkaloidigena TaxID=1075417 RepID=UPI00240502BA|nr:hypothetical protein [Catalinimonas alkaloidigena]MDF9798764.1 hypothetical protein [Catalinimonas alkaloidigena]